MAAIARPQQHQQQVDREWLHWYLSKQIISTGRECSHMKDKAQGIRVQFIDLNHVYLKVQSRVGRESRQRLVDARVRMIVTFQVQIQKIRVFVERNPEAAALVGDVNGRVELETRMGKLERNKQYLSVDLDSVYQSPQGTPVYKLSTVEAEKRNRFRVVVVIVYGDGSQSKSYYSRSFLIRSRRSSFRRSSSCASTS